jgi:hypothetical protein
MITRNLIKGYYAYGLEISTPALNGQSGGPLIDTKGLLCGINTHISSLEFHYNFKIPAPGTLNEKVTIKYQPMLIVGQCLHADIIKNFLRANGIKYYEG